jgi:hypothetical protein
MISPNKRLSTSSNFTVPKILTDFYSLIDSTVAITKVCRLRITKMDAQTLC